MSVLRAVGRWAADWRNIAVIVAAALTAYLGVLVVSAVIDQQRALDTAVNATSSEREARQAAVQRIDQLLAEIKVLEGDAQANAAQIAALRQEVGLLQQQVRDLGGQPIVVGAGGGAQSSPRPSSSVSPRRSRSPSPSRSPSRTPTPTPSPTCVAVFCLR